MAYRNSEKNIEKIVETGVYKTTYPFLKILILGFQAGAFIALGYLLSIRMTAVLPESLTGLSSLVGASVFPIGLILTLLVGGELLTGNMMAVPFARLAHRVQLRKVFSNWALVAMSNFMGAIFIAYFFGHIVGLTETAPYMAETVSIAEHKLEATFLQAFISGIGCNWLVAAAVWLCYSSDDLIGKMVGIWFPTMAFVALGFQHVVANMFVIPAAIFAGHFTWIEYIGNFFPVLLGNAVGGSVFIAGAYWHAYKKNDIHLKKKQSATSYPQPLAKTGEQ
ncbi:formate/nitrite transporter family protein [Mesobacillus maritimus]|uniref:Formate/nitrite transporter family protein n=1 Tax=Mesobacillus maritimus TaxID=1643336 RepID=A0ABS7K978_9BACI|nr:formate/nitrite transporter family protein [Mesobacillus maritimus]MBY0098630.1 formate/nitrite transporter family protein [Mesobacillus maritimus]